MDMLGAQEVSQQVVLRDVAKASMALLGQARIFCLTPESSQAARRRRAVVLGALAGTERAAEVGGLAARQDPRSEAASLQ